MLTLFLKSLLCNNLLVLIFVKGVEDIHINAFYLLFIGFSQLKLESFEFPILTEEQLLPAVILTWLCFHPNKFEIGKCKHGFFQQFSVTSFQPFWTFFSENIEIKHKKIKAILFSFCAPHEMLTFVLGTFVIAFLALIVAVKETAFFNPEDL